MTPTGMRLHGYLLERGIDVYDAILAIEDEASRCGCTICDDAGEPCPKRSFVCQKCQDICWGMKGTPTAAAAERARIRASTLARYDKEEK